VFAEMCIYVHTNIHKNFPFSCFYSGEKAIWSILCRAWSLCVIAVRESHWQECVPWRIVRNMKLSPSETHACKATSWSFIIRSHTASPFSENRRRIDGIISRYSFTTWYFDLGVNSIYLAVKIMRDWIYRLPLWTSSEYQR